MDRVCSGGQGDCKDVNSNDDDVVCSGIKLCRVIR